MAAFAAITLAGVALGSVVSLVLGAALGVIAYNELRGGSMLRRFEPGGATLLGWNQVALGVLIVSYAAWSLASALGAPPLAALGGSTGDAQLDAMAEQITAAVTYGLYGGMAAAGMLVPGLTSLYYFSRGRLVRRMVEQTPPWVIQTLRAAG